MKFNNWLLSESSRIPLAWSTIIVLAMSFAYILYTFLVTPSILIFSILCMFIIIYIIIFRIFGGFRKYISHAVGSTVELDINKWYDLNYDIDYMNDYQRNVIEWLANNNIKYYKNYGSTFYLLKKTDAMAFKLRWI